MKIFKKILGTLKLEKHFDSTITIALYESTITTKCFSNIFIKFHFGIRV